jgi:hypothetical protein
VAAGHQQVRQFQFQAVAGEVDDGVMPGGRSAATADGTSPVSSRVWRALRPRKQASSSPGRTVLIASAPRAAASCTANSDAAGSARHQHGLPWQRGYRVA